MRIFLVYDALWKYPEMQFSLDKCAKVTLKKGSLVKSKNIILDYSD